MPLVGLAVVLTIGLALAPLAVEAQQPGKVSRFIQEHLYCGELDSDVENDRVWMTCTCGAVLVRVVAFG